MIEYRTGNVLDVPERPVVLAHVVNDQGRWGAGFSGALSRRWPAARTTYRAWMKGSPTFGAVVAYQMERDVYCAHLLAQRGCPGIVVYSALSESLTTLSKLLDANLPLSVPVAMPRIGCGLGHGSWERVEPLIADAFFVRRVLVYTFPDLDNARPGLGARRRHDLQSVSEDGYARDERVYRGTCAVCGKTVVCSEAGVSDETCAESAPNEKPE